MKAQCLTLPDFYGKAWGPAVEVLVSLLTCISFICLLAGNLVRRSLVWASCSLSDSSVFFSRTPLKPSPKAFCVCVVLLL